MEQRQISVGPADLEVLAGGEGPPLLLLHGEDGLLFADPLLAECARHFEVLAPHHPGWGGSTRPQHVDRPRDVAEIYAELLESLPAPVTLLGCSLGAWIAAELALLRPREIGALVLAAPIGAKFGAREEREFVDLYVTPDAAIADVLYGSPAAGPDYSRFSAEDWVSLARAQEAVARYCWVPYMHDPKLAPRLRRLASVPTLIVCGTDDRFVLRPGYFDAFAAAISSAPRVHALQGVGHRVEEEAPEALARIAAAFAREQIGERMLVESKGA